MSKKNRLIIPHADELRNKTYCLPQNKLKYPILTLQQVLIKILNAYELNQRMVYICHAYVDDRTCSELEKQGFKLYKEVDALGVPRCTIIW